MEMEQVQPKPATETHPIRVRTALKAGDGFEIDLDSRAGGVEDLGWETATGGSLCIEVSTRS